MKFTTSILEDHVHGAFYGLYKRELVNEYVAMIVNFCKLKKYGKLFFDFRNVEGEVATFERYKLAEHLASLEPDNIRIAAVVTEDQSRPLKVAETVASTRSISVKISTDEEEVMEWLLNEKL